jgi:hypothetical protein
MLSSRMRHGVQMQIWMRPPTSTPTVDRHWCGRDVTGDVSWRGALRSWRGGVGTFGYGSTPHAGSG